MRSRPQILFLLLIIIGCSRFEPPARPTIDQIAIDDSQGLGSSGLAQVTHPRFGGVADLLGGDGWIRVGWNEATDDLTPAAEIEYLIYVTPFGNAFDLSQPTTSVIGTDHVLIEGLTNGNTLEVLVLARDTDLEVSPEQVSWPVTPHPIRYVRSGAAQGGANGLTPETAFPTMGQAIATSIPLGGVNIHVAEGLYPENLFLLSGMMVFGGFESSFDPDLRDPVQQPSQFGILFQTDLVNIRPGDQLSGIDGLILGGNGVAESCVYAEDCVCRITRCQMSGAITQGLDLRSDYLEGNTVTAFISDCVISECNGEGLRIVGIPQIQIDDSVFRNNLNEGIESQWVYSGFGETSSVEISRCRVFDNGDEGIDLDVASIPGDLPGIGLPSATRIKIRNCEVTGNFLEGIVIDLDSSPLDDLDIRVRIDDSRISDNGLAGIFLDGDAQAAFRVNRNQITVNGGAGVSVSSIPDGSEALIRNCNILGNAGVGVEALDLCSLYVTHCWISDNALGSLDAPRGVIQCQDSIVNAADATELGCIRYSLVAGTDLPVSLPNGSTLGETHLLAEPVEIQWGEWDPTGVLISATPLSLSPGTMIELADDGILRDSIPLVGGGYEVIPPPARAGGPVGIIVWKPGQGPMEDSTPLANSAALNSGNPWQDIDGIPQNIGPSGNNPLSFVGPDTALPDPPSQSQLMSISPSSSTIQSSTSWELRFTRPPSPELTDALHFSVNGIDQRAQLAVTVENEVVRLDYPDLLPGDQTLLEILPHNGLENGSDLYRVVSQNVGQLIEEDVILDLSNNSAASTPPLPGESFRVTGQLNSPSDEDWYLLEVTPGQPLQVEVLARRKGSSLIPQLEVRDPASGDLLLSASAEAPFFFDPYLLGVMPDPSGMVLIRVLGPNSPILADLSYELFVQP